MLHHGKGTLKTQPLWAKTLTSPPNLPEVREAPLALLAQVPRSQRETVSPPLIRSKGSCLLTWPRSGWGLQSQKTELPGTQFPKRRLRTRDKLIATHEPLRRWKQKKKRLPGNVLEASILPYFFFFEKPENLAVLLGSCLCIATVAWSGIQAFPSRWAMRAAVNRSPNHSLVSLTWTSAFIWIWDLCL